MADEKDIEIIKKEYVKETEARKQQVKIMKIVTYVLVSILLALIVSFFIVKVILEKNIYFFDEIEMPLIIMVFGAIAILMTQINGKMSKTNDVTGDKLVLVLGIILCLGGVALLLYNVIRH